MHILKKDKNKKEELGLQTIGKQSICFAHPPYILSSASVVGKKEGEGMLVYERNEKGEPIEYYKGTFKNDKLQGFGVNHYKNGSEWIGTFNENEQNGYGLFVNGERYSITKYSLKAEEV